MTDITDIGPLDWRIGIVDKTGRPTPEFQRRWNSQRNNNALIGTITFGTGVPPASPAPADGAEYIDTTNVPAILYVGHSGSWLQIGPINFTDLLDVPHDYTGYGSQLVRVTTSEDGLEFGTLTSAIDLAFGNTEGNLLVRGSSGWEALGAGTATDVLTSNGPGAVPSWQPSSGGGGGGGRMLFDLGTMPALSTFTQIGVGGSVSAFENPGKSLTLLNTSPPNDSGIFISALATPVPITTPYRVAVFAISDGSNTNFLNVGVGYRDSATGRIETHQLLSTQTYMNRFERDQWNTNTSRSSANVENQFYPYMGAGVWLGLHDDGAGTITMEFSTTGGNWIPVYTINKSSGWLANYNDQIILMAGWDDNTIGGSPQAANFLCYDPNGLTRVVG